MTLRPVWICLLFVGCGSKQPAPANPQSADTEPAPATAAEPASPPAAEPAPAPAPAAADKPLFERLGGLPAITAVVDEFVGRTTTDPRIKQRFFNTDAVQLKKFLVEFVASASGGGVKYTGRDMASSHAGMDLVDDEFTALVEDLVAALDKFKVPAREKDQVIAFVVSLKPDIVEK